ncbi:MAG TPA: hypothetical protein VFV63_13975, partial [Ilumatobacteraceae bacterium]|nr:hypothetical protein [Ilumatobacteraceae bacterium]
PNPYSAALRYRYPDERLLWIEEGAQTTVSIQEQSDGTRVMYLDGLHQANDSAFMVGYHSLIGALAVALHPNPREALVVGLGGGVTAHGVSAIPTVHVEVVELSGEVVRGAEYLERANGGVVDKPNVDIRVDDVATTSSSPRSATTSSPPTSSSRCTRGPARCGRSSTGSWPETRWRTAG